MSRFEKPWAHTVNKMTQNPDNLKVISFGRIAANINYQSIRKGLEDTRLKDGFRFIMKQVCKVVEEKQWVGLEGAGEEVANAILKYPKVALERNFETPPNFENVFIEEGKIKLPFPKIVVLTGQYETEERVYGYMDEYGSLVNRLAFYVVTQQEDAIAIHTLLAEDTEKPLHIATTGVEVFLDGETQVLSVASQTHITQTKWIPKSANIIYDVLRAIYMMTYHTGEVYISVPTPREAEVNEKKMRKGKKPLVEFRLISVTAQKRALPSIPQGTHASPRQHWRRGHWRTYKSGLRAWVEPMLVGDEKNGKIVKDYVIGHYAEDKRNGTMRASKTPSQSQYHAPI
jgi:hypothetical protein